LLGLEILGNQYDLPMTESNPRIYISTNYSGFEKVLDIKFEFQSKRIAGFTAKLHNDYLIK